MLHYTEPYAIPKLRVVIKCWKKSLFLCITGRYTVLVQATAGGGGFEVLNPEWNFTLIETDIDFGGI